MRAMGDTRGRQGGDIYSTLNNKDIKKKDKNKIAKGRNEVNLGHLMPGQRSAFQLGIVTIFIQPIDFYIFDE